MWPLSIPMFYLCLWIQAAKGPFLLCRCVRPLRRATHRKLTREIAMRTRRILQKSIPKPTNPLWKTSSAATLTSHRQLTSHRTTLLRKASWEDANWNLDQGHVTLREFVFVALHGDHVTYNVASARGGLILALRLPAVPAQPALRLQQIPRPVRGRSDVIQRVPREHWSAKRGVLPSQQG